MILSVLLCPCGGKIPPLIALRANYFVLLLVLRGLLFSVPRIFEKPSAAVASGSAVTLISSPSDAPSSSGIPNRQLPPPVRIIPRFAMLPRSVGVSER